MEIFNEEMRRFWNNWDLRAMVLVNLILQLFLLFLGSRRKSSNKIPVRVVVWCAYIGADSVGGVALGILSSKLGDQINSSKSGGLLEEESKMIAFWAPCLLLLLGGPDTITAYAMEDNELWLRHLLGLVVQSAVTAYICMMSWSTASYLSYLSLAMFVSAVIKYGERVWVLWKSSKEKREDSILAPPYAGMNYPSFMEDYVLTQLEGYQVVVDEIVERPVPKKVPATNSIPDAEFLVKAQRLHPMVLRLFYDLVLTDEDREFSESIFKEIKDHWEPVFKIVEIELSFMYDLLHTKAILLYSRWGLGRRLVTLAISSVSLIIFFCFADRPLNKYDRTNLAATFLLLGVILLLDLYSILAMLTSDWTHVWLSKKDTSPKFGLDRVVPRLKWCRPARWSNSVSQLTLLSFCTKPQSVPCQSFLKRLHIREKVENYYHTRHESGKQLDIVKKAMLDYIVNFQYSSERDVKSRNDLKYCLADVVRRHLGSNISDLEWSTEMEFDKSILVWHVATELCYHKYSSMEEKLKEVEEDEGGWQQSDLLVAKILSQYMYYLLVLYPFMLPRGIGQIRVRDTCAEAHKFFEGRGFWSMPSQCNGHSEACKLLLQVNTQVPPKKVKGESSKSVLFDGCRLANELINLFAHKEKVSDHGRKGSKAARRVITDIWLEILAIAASQCSGESHAMQLRRGGELLTFQWLLLAHFGLTDHFQLTKGHVIAQLILH